MGWQWRQAASSVADTVFKCRFNQQFAALFYKNVLVAWRSRRSTALRLFAPFLFLLMALIVNLALNANNALQERFTAVPVAQGVDIPHIPSCGDDLYIAGRPCVDFVWTPNNDSAAEAIVNAVRASNSPAIPADKVLGFRTRHEADAYMMAHPDGCLGAVHFVRQQGASGAFSYIVTSNSTVKYFKGTFQDPVNFFQLPMINAVARELSRSYVARATSSNSSNSSSRGASGLVSSAAAFEWSPRMVRFPHPSLQTINLLGQVLSSFIFASLMFGCVSQISSLVGERDAGLRLSLSNMGMSQAAYWTSWMAFDTLLTLATAVLLVLFGMLLQFDYFLKNSFGLLLMLFWLFSMAMTSFSYMLSVLVKKPQGAMYLGFSVFIVGWMFQTVQFLVKLPYTPSTYYSTTNKWGRVFFWVFSLYPWNPLTKGILDLNQATMAPTDPGLQWSQLYSYCSYEPDPSQQAPYDPRHEFRSYDCIYPLWQVYLTLLLQWVAYWLLAVYLSNILPNEVGARRPWNYYLQPSYWRPRPTDTSTALQQLLADEAEGVCRPPPVDGVVLDGDVETEEHKMRELLEQRAGLMAPQHCKDPDITSGSSSSSSPASRYAAELYGLRKVFKGGRTPLSCRPTFMCKPCMSPQADEGEDGLLGLVTATGSNDGSSGGSRWYTGGRRREDFWAIRGTWLGIERGQLFCLLGPNGAGKTTTINCLTGVLPFSGGNALIYGTAINSEGGLDRVRPLMGVCPQFDVLWGELSGAEHLTIAGHIKGLPWNKVQSEAADLLSRVHLSHAAGLRSASYSGGMKRRLSVALALLGDPRIVYLDEPTTGMDPISRRHVWDIITAAKPGRAIVLTTHSMEEADVLGDRIAIMARGSIRALGSSLRLKQKYGSGYQLTVHVSLPASLSTTFSCLGPAKQQELAARVDEVKQVFRSDLGIEPVDESRNLLHYLVGPSVSQQQLIAFLQRLEAEGDILGVEDIQCSLASLEEVFLNIAKQAELEAAAASGSSLVCVDLPGGGSLMVPLGEEEVVAPDGSGRTYSIKWSQDDAGRLVVLSCIAKQQQQQHLHSPRQLPPQQQQEQQQTYTVGCSPRQGHSPRAQVLHNAADQLQHSPRQHHRLEHQSEQQAFQQQQPQQHEEQQMHAMLGQPQDCRADMGPFATQQLRWQQQEVQSAHCQGPDLPQQQQQQHALVEQQLPEVLWHEECRQTPQHTSHLQQASSLPHCQQQQPLRQFSSQQLAPSIGHAGEQQRQQHMGLHAQASAALDMQDSGVSDAPLPRLSECIRFYTSTADKTGRP